MSYKAVPVNLKRTLSANLNLWCNWINSLLFCMFWSVPEDIFNRWHSIQLWYFVCKCARKEELQNCTMEYIKMSEKQINASMFVWLTFTVSLGKEPNFVRILLVSSQIPLTVNHDTINLFYVRYHGSFQCKQKYPYCFLFP